MQILLIKNMSLSHWYRNIYHSISSIKSKVVYACFKFCILRMLYIYCVNKTLCHHAKPTTHRILMEILKIIFLILAYSLGIATLIVQIICYLKIWSIRKLFLQWHCYWSLLPQFKVCLWKREFIARSFRI